MKASLFFSYPLRSLRRGGGSVRLATVCIAIGVMVVVAIQLIGQMATNAYASNVREANGGDIAARVSDTNNPLTQRDLQFFTQLKQKQIISNYTPVNQESGAIGQTPPPFMGLIVQIVDPRQFPLVTTPTFISPTSGSLATLLTGDQVVVTPTFLDHYHKQVGDTFDLQIQSTAQSGTARTLHVRLAGVIGGYPSGNTFIIISFAEYQAASPSQPLTYDSVDITTPDQAHTDQAIQAIQDEVRQGHLPSMSVQTLADMRKTVLTFNNQQTELQELAALLALLIGGIGIMNTMQVLLARRTVEIAMLKTTGYSRSTLAVLFGIETGVLGLIGGIIGTGIAVAISYGVVTTLLAVPFVLDPGIIGGGLALGTVTALIFGLMPIVQSANIRPIQVLREQSGSTSFGYSTSILVLSGIVSLLFCAVASIILGNVLLGCASVLGIELFLAVVSLCFRPIIEGISHIPVPERLSTKYLGVVLAGGILAALLCLRQPVLGGIVLACLVLVLLLQVLPHSWKINVRIALHNIGRRPMRTTMLMLILFVNVFAIGSIQLISQDLQSNLATSMNQALSYNVIVKVPSQQAQAMEAQLPRLPGLLESHSTTLTTTSIVAINGQPWNSFLSPADRGLQTSSNSPAYQLLHSTDGLEGYNLAENQLPNSNAFKIVEGRNLNASDAGTNNVLIPYSAIMLKTFPLTVGTTLTVVSSDGKINKTLMVVGEYSSTGLSLAHINPILAGQSLVTALGANSEQTVFYLKVDPTSAALAAAKISDAMPNAAFVTTPANRVDAYLQGLSSIVWIFTVMACIVLLAGMLIMANAIMLDMLARRRELGILKAIGYTKKTIRGEILLEYGVIGGVSAILAVVLVTLLSNFLGNMLLRVTSSYLSTTGTALNLNFNPNETLFASLIVGAILLAMLASLLASWRTVKISPMDVLRYE